MGGRRIVITGAGGRLGRQLVEVFRAAGDEVVPLTHRDFDLARPDSTEAIVNAEPEIVVNAAAWTDVDGCARDPERAMEMNGEGAGRVARAAAAAKALLVHVSTNEVFDGAADRPYREDDEARPVNAYGESKLRGELRIREVSEDHLIVRTAWLFGPEGASFVTKIRAAADRARNEHRPLQVVADEWGNPTWTPALAERVEALTRTSARGIVHLAGEPAVSRYEWARAALDGWSVDLEPVALASFERPSTPPAFAVLDLSRARSIGLAAIQWEPHLDEAGRAQKVEA